MPPLQLGNAFNSLGNDYSALAETGAKLGVDAFRRAVAAYRRALLYRPKRSDPIEWARTQFNLATNYGRACRLTSGALMQRHGLAALARFDSALSVLNLQNSPVDWTYCCVQMAEVAIYLLDEGFSPGLKRIERTIGKLTEVGEIGDLTGDFKLVVNALTLQCGFMQHLFVQRGPDASRLIEFSQIILRRRQEGYLYTPLRLYFALADAQMTFMLAHLSGNRPGVEKAMASVESFITGPWTDDEGYIVSIAREVLVDMNDVADQLET